MDVLTIINKLLKKNGEVKTSDIVSATGFSRAYINRFLRELQDEGRIVLVGKANQARYIPATRQAFLNAMLAMMRYRRSFANQQIREEFVLNEINSSTGILLDVPQNVVRIVEYAFSEMLNNAIEHSHSATIMVSMQRERTAIAFTVVDRGIGIFRNIMQTKKLRSELEAIQDLIKGKQTTAPKHHSGEGIFFTSKVADRLVISGSKKRLIFDNQLDDIFVNEGTVSRGTKVEFHIAVRSPKNLKKIFGRYTDKEFVFDTTQITVHLFQRGTNFMSRSEARRILSGLEKFSTIILDFKKVDFIGQGFADEIFRVWQNSHPNINIETVNASKDVQFMMRHVQP